MLKGMLKFHVENWMTVHWVLEHPFTTMHHIVYFSQFSFSYCSPWSLGPDLGPAIMHSEIILRTSYPGKQNPSEESKAALQHCTFSWTNHHAQLKHPSSATK